MEMHCLCWHLPGGGALQRCSSSPSTSQHCSRGLWHRHLRCSWAGAVQTCSVVRMGPVGRRSACACGSARGKGANRDPAHVPAEQVGRGGQPPSEPLCKCQHLNQSRNIVSVEVLPRRMGSVSIQAGGKDLCQSAPVVTSAMGKFSPINETSPSAESHLYSGFHGDLVCGVFIHSVNSCVVFKAYFVGRDFWL